MTPGQYYPLIRNPKTNAEPKGLEHYRAKAEPFIATKNVNIITFNFS